MLRDILGGKSAHLPMMNESEVRRTMSTYDVNEPQAKAIIGSTRIDGFALIQG
jgi:senataxin